MIRLLHVGRRAVNRIINQWGIEVVRLRNDLPDLSLYEEKERPETPRYVNIGAGGFFHPFWHNLDTPNEYYAEIQKNLAFIHYDLTAHKPLPFESDTLKVAYTSHVIEHIHDDDVVFLFKEVYRCLQPGGCFRVTCPDIDLEYDAYMRNDRSFWKWPNAYGVFNTSIEQMFLDHFATSLTKTHPEKTCRKLTDKDIREIFEKYPKEDALDHIVGLLTTDIQKKYPGDHINWFNHGKISEILSSAGFSNVYESGYGQSKCVQMRDKQLFDSTCPELSVYVECVKQANRNSR